MVKKQETNTAIKVAAGISAGVILVSAGFLGGAIYGHNSVIIPGCPVSEPSVEYINETVIEKVNVTQEVFIEVDNGKYAQVIKGLEDRDVISDDEDIFDVIQSEDLAIELAILAIEDDYADELEDADLVKDEKDVELVYVKSDFEDINVIKSDFDDNEYKFEILAKVYDEDEEENKKVLFTVEVNDGEAKIKSVSSE